MFVLGTPLMLLFSWLRITGFLSFSLAGLVCTILPVIFLARDPGWNMFVLFGVQGMIAGYLFRLMLFGFRRDQPFRR